MPGGRSKVWTPEVEQWLLTAAWKRHTLTEISSKINVSTSVINLFYKRHNISPMTKRDFIASKVLDAYNKNDNKRYTVKDLALLFDCSEETNKTNIK